MTTAIVFLAWTCALFLAFRSRPHWLIMIIMFANYIYLDRIADTPGSTEWVMLKALGPALALIAIYHWFWRDEPPFDITKVAAALVGYGLLLAISVSYARNSEIALEGVELYFRYIGLGLIVILAMRSFFDLTCLAWAFLAGATFLGAIGIYIFVTGSFDETFYGMGRVALSNFHGDVRGYRYEGPIDANELATLLVFVVPVAIERLLNSEAILARIAAGLAVLACLIGILLTGSRGGWLALTVIGLVTVALRPRRIQLILIPLAVLVIIMLVPREYIGRALSVGSLVGLTDEAPDGSLYGRMNALKVAWALFLDNPILGVGTNNYDWSFQEYGMILGLPNRGHGMAAHNSYAEVATEQGIVGLIAFLGLLSAAGTGLIQVQRSLRSAGRTKDADLVFAFAIGCLGYLVGVLFLSFLGRFFWMMLTIVLAMPAIVAAHPSRAPDGPPSAARLAPFTKAAGAQSNGSRAPLARTAPGGSAIAAGSSDHARASPDAGARPSEKGWEGAAARARPRVATLGGGPAVIISGARCSGVSAVARRVGLLDAPTPPDCVVAAEDADAIRLLNKFPHARMLWVYAHYRRAVLANLARFGAQACLTELARHVRLLEAGTGRRSFTNEILVLSGEIFGRNGNALAAAALSWHLKTGEYFRLRLDREPRVILVAYDVIVVDPAAATASLRAWLNLLPGGRAVVDNSDDDFRHYDPESFDDDAVPARIRDLCDDLWIALERERERQRTDQALRVGTKA